MSTARKYQILNNSLQIEWKNLTLAETSDLSAAISAEQTARDSAIAVETTNRQAADSAEVTARNSAISSAVSAEQTARDAAILVETTNRQAADSAEVTARNSAITSAINTEVTARDAAIAVETTNRINAVNAEVTARDSAIAVETTARIAADAGLQAQITASFTNLSWGVGCIAATADARLTTTPDGTALSTLLPFSDDDAPFIVIGDFADGQYLLFKSGTSSAIFKIYDDAGTLKLTKTAVAQPVLHSAYIVQNDLPATPQENETVAVYARTSADVVRIGTFAWNLATGINLNTFTAAPGLVVTGDTIQAAIQKIVGNINAEITARQNAISGEQTARDAAILVETTNRQAAVLAEVTARNSAITAAIATEQTARDAAILVETTNRQAADATEVTNRNTAITTAINTEITARNAAISAEQTARDAAILIETTNRQAAVLAEQTARDAAILVETTSRQAADATEVVNRNAAIAAIGAKSLTNDNAGAMIYGKVVYVKSNGHFDVADASNTGDANLGLVWDASIGTGAAGLIMLANGKLIPSLSGMTPGATQYLGASGAMTETAPSSGYFWEIGKADSATEMKFNPIFRGFFS